MIPETKATYLLQEQTKMLHSVCVYGIHKNVTLNFDLCPSWSQQCSSESKSVIGSKPNTFPQGAVLRSHIQEPNTVIYQVTVNSTFDLWPTKSDQFIHESWWMFVTNIKTCRHSLTEISCLQEQDEQTTWWQYACSSDCPRHRSIKIQRSWPRLRWPQEPSSCLTTSQTKSPWCCHGWRQTLWSRG